MISREAVNVLSVLEHTRIRDLITQPPYAAVFSLSDAAIAKGQVPAPVFQAVKPTNGHRR